MKAGIWAVNSWGRVIVRDGSHRPGPPCDKTSMSGLAPPATSTWRLAHRSQMPGLASNKLQMSIKAVSAVMKAAV